MVPVWTIVLTLLFVYVVHSAPKFVNSSKTVSLICDRPHSITSGLEPINLVISGFFPMSGLDSSHWNYKSVIKPAVDSALEDIKRHPCVLKGYSLIIERKDTQCKSAKGMKTLFNAMDSETPKLAVFGEACTNVDEPLAMTTNYFHMVQVSYAETHPKFTLNKEKYSYFYRMVPTYRNIFTTRIQLLKYFNWTRVGIIVQHDDSRYALPQEEVQNALQTKFGINVIVSGGFSASKMNHKDAILKLKKHDARIILGFFNRSIAGHIFCEAFREGLTGSMHVWILSSFNDDQWWRRNRSNCTHENFTSAINNHFLLDFSTYRTDREKTINGTIIDADKSKLFPKCSGRYCDRSFYQGYIYDGVWALALALENVILEHTSKQINNGRIFNPNVDIKWDDKESQKIWGEQLLSYLNASAFQGVTGLVRFENNERLGTIRIAQFQNSNYVPVGEYDTAGDRFLFDESLILWAGKSVPKDRIRHEIVDRYVDFAVFCIMSSLTVSGMVVALCFLIVNIYFRNHKFIKMSSPNMNNLIVVGSLLTYLSVVLIGLDTSIVSQNVYGYLCSAKVWILSCGFTLAFGSMFSKTWRVHSIFTNIKLHKKVIKDYKLFILVFILLLIDLIILIVWLIIDPMHWHHHLLPVETHAERNLKIEPKIESCHSEYKLIFQGLLLSVKGLLLIVGCFLAWETKHVNVPALNDSKYIGMSVYNVVVMCSLGVPISFILSDNINACYILISVFIIFCTTLTLFLVFLPKVVELARNPKDDAHKYRQTMMKSVGTALQRAPSAGSDEGQYEELSRAEELNVEIRRVLEDRNREIMDILAELSQLGDQICIMPSIENTSISRVSHSSIPEDPFGGVYIGPISPPTMNLTETTICASSKSQIGDDVTEKTSLLSSLPPMNYRPEKRGTSLKLPKMRPSSSRTSFDKSLIIENDLLSNNSALYQSMTSVDEDVLKKRRLLDNFTKEPHLSFISYIDSLRSDDILSTSRTLPSIKESCVGTFSDKMSSYSQLMSSSSEDEL